MDEQSTGGFQCMVWLNNNIAEEMFLSKRKQSFFQWLEVKNIGLVLNTFFIQIHMSKETNTKYMKM